MPLPYRPILTHRFTMTSPRPFRLEVSDDMLDRIRARVVGWVRHEMPDDGSRGRGANLEHMRELCVYRLDASDRRAREERFSRISHFAPTVQGIDLHVTRATGNGAAPMRRTAPSPP